MEFDHSTDTISPDDQAVITFGGTGAIVLPAGTTAQRPSAANGVIRYNSDTSSLDFVINGAYQTIRGVTTIAATGISAAGTNQGTATAITAALNNVTTVGSGQGVILPVPLAGDEVVVINNGANALNVYPQSGSTIDDLASNAPSVLAVGKVLTLRAVSSTLWEISGDTGASGGGAVSSVTGTANQVTVSPTTGATVVSLPSTIIAPGTVQATGSFIAGTNTNSLTSTTGTSMVVKPGAAATTTSIGNTVTVQGGDGGTTSGAGGNVSVVGGAPTSGQGGTVFIAAGNGIGTNQSGGNTTITAGSQTGTGTAGNVSITAGQMIAAGTPGTVLITGGTGFGAVSGGAVQMIGGSGGSTAQGGSAFVTGGPGGSTSGKGGLAQFSGGTPVNGAGGDAQFSAAAGVGTNQAGGLCLLLGGAATGTATGGLASVQAGATVTGTGGVAYLTGGAGGTTGTGGDISITSGAGGSTSGNAGNVFIVGGTPVNGDGGDVNITGSAGVGTNRSGGNVAIAAGDRTGSGTAGFINLIIPATGTLQVNGAAGTSGQVLTSQGATAAPIWTTVSGGGGSPGGSTTQIQYNNAGAFAGDADFTWDATNNDLVLGGTDTGITLQGITNEPSPPAAGRGHLYAKDIAARMMPKWVGPSGYDYPIQSHIAFNNTSWWVAAGNSTTITAVGAAALTATGTATAINVATTNIYTMMRKLEYLVTTAATTAVAGFRGGVAQRRIGTPSASIPGGFFFACRWGPATGVATTTNRGFVGMTNSTAAPTDVQPSTLTNMVGMGWDAADTNIQLMCNDGAGTATKTDLGASFPVPTADRTNMYELVLFSPNSTTQSVGYRVTNLGTNAQVSGTITTDIPSNTTLLAPRGWMSVGGTSSVIGIALTSLYIETDF